MCFNLQLQRPCRGEKRYFFFSDAAANNRNHLKEKKKFIYIIYIYTLKYKRERGAFTKKKNPPEKIGKILPQFLIWVTHIAVLTVYTFPFM
jgi:type IV secretory pathway VirB6-like protein